MFSKLNWGLLRAPLNAAYSSVHAFLKPVLSVGRAKNLLPYLLIVGAASFLLFVNLIYQLVNKPAELFGLFVPDSYKTTQETWNNYGKYFKRHSTNTMTPEFLCALAQVESSGNRYATPQWRFRWTSDITRIYAPASSAVGLMQYTDGTFEEARRFCIHDHKVALAGRLFDFDSCWFNLFYSRLSASNSIEMTSARLHFHINEILNDCGYTVTSLKDRQKLGAVIHLCGRSKGRKFAETNFSFDAISPCGSHNPAIYYGRIEIIMSSLIRSQAGSSKRSSSESRFQMK